MKSNVPQSPGPLIFGKNSGLENPPLWTWQLRSLPMYMSLSGPAEWISTNGVEAQAVGASNAAATADSDQPGGPPGQSRTSIRSYRCTTSYGFLAR